MAKRMKLWVVGALLLTVVGGAVASNMGFKFVPNLNIANSAFPVGIPFNHNYTDAQSIYADIQASGCSPASVSRIFGPAEKGVSSWFPGAFGEDFTVTTSATGEGYSIQVTSPCTTWVIVGSHNPAQSISMTNVGSPTYLLSVPYHTTAIDANSFFTEIGPNLVQVDRISGAGAKGHTTWFPGAFGNNFAVKIGEALDFSVSAPTSWTPAHY